MVPNLFSVLTPSLGVLDIETYLVIRRKTNPHQSPPIPTRNDAQEEVGDWNRAFGAAISKVEEGGSESDGFVSHNPERVECDR